MASTKVKDIVTTTTASTTDFLIKDKADGSITEKITIANVLAKAGSNVKTVAYTIGIAGVTGVDHNFTSVANSTEQSIQLGSTTIIPAFSVPTPTVIHCVAGLSGVITGTADLGTTSGGNDIISVANVDDTDETHTSTSVGVTSTSAAVSSIYFSFTPSADWDTITTGQWKVWITYVDNSVV